MDQIQSIKAFVTVIRLESFTKAARQLNMSLPSLSRAVSNLESHTQTRLVIRSSRFVSLAPAAREYFDICVDILDRLREGEQRLLDDHAKPRGVLRIAAHPIAIEAGLPKIISQYQLRAPEVEIVLNTHSLPIRLERDKYEVAVYPPDLILDGEAVCRRLLISPTVLVASQGYLDQTGFDQSQRNLSDHVIVSCRTDLEGERVVRLERDSRVTTVPIGKTLMNVGESAAIQLALSGFGMVLVPEFLAAPHLADAKLQHVFPDYRVISDVVALGVAYMRQGTIPHRIRSFVDMCKRFFGAAPREDTRKSIGLSVESATVLPDPIGNL